MSDVSAKTYSAVVLPDPRITYADAYSASLSSVTQAGPLPGIPEAQNVTSMVLETSGTQSANGSIRLRAQDGGHPGPEGGSFIWKNESDSDSQFRGWDPPMVLTDWEVIHATTTGQKWKQPHAITLSTGEILVAVLKDDQYIRCWSRATTDVWTETAVADHGGTYAFNASPTLVELPSGRVLCFFWVESGNDNQVRLYYSDNKGSTWTQGQRACLVNVIDTTVYHPERMRAAYANGQVCLVAWVTNAALTRDDILMQWASSDLGMNFQLIDTMSGSTDANTSGAYCDLITYGGKFLLGALRETSAASGDAVPYLRTVGSAYTPFSSSSLTLMQSASDPMRWGTIVASAFTDGDFTLWADDEGTLYCAGRDTADLSNCSVKRSSDGGVSWTYMGSGTSGTSGTSFWRGNDASTHPYGFVGTAQGGRSLLIGIHVASAGTTGPSLSCMYLGGYTQLPLPLLSETEISFRRASPEFTYLPFDLPEALGGIWSVVSTGTPTIDATTATLKIVQAAGQSTTYTTVTTPPGSVQEGITDTFTLSVAGGNTGHPFVKVRVADGTPISYEVRVTVTGTTIVVRDEIAGADLGSVATTVQTTDGVQVKLHIYNNEVIPANNGHVRVWYRAATTNPDHQWTEIGAWATLTAGGTTTHRIQWGVLTGAGTCYWKQHHWGSDSFTGYIGALYNFVNAHDLQGRYFSATNGIVTDGVKVKAVKGPAYRNDSWVISTRYQYGIDRIFPEVQPSPQVEWRSTSTSTQQEIVVEVSSTAAQTSPLLGRSFGLYLGEINFRTFTIQGRNAAGAWVTIGNGDAALATGLRFTRDGDTVRVDTGGATSMKDYLPYNILADSYFKLAAGSARKIRINSEGAFNSVNTKRPHIQLESYSPFDAASGTTGEIWSKDVLLIRNDASVYSAYKIIIPSGQPTAEGYYKIGAMIFGHVAYFAWPVSASRSIGWTPNTEMTTARNGSRRVRKAGKVRRTASFGIEEPADLSQMFTSIPAPDYVTAYTGGQPVATPWDTPWLFGGVIEALSGAASTLVYVAKIDFQSAATTNLNLTNRANILYARIASAQYSMDTVYGQELSDPGELVRGSRWGLEEEI